MWQQRCWAFCSLLVISSAVLAHAQVHIDIAVKGPNGSSMDSVMIDQGSQELRALANYMQLGAAGTVPGGKQTFASKHPNLALAMQLGIFLKAMEKLSDSNFLEKRDGKLEGVLEQVENFLPPKEEFYVQVADGNFIVGDTALLGKGHRVCRKLYLSGTNKYELVEAGAGAPYLYDAKLAEPGLVGPETVRRLMEDAKKDGLQFIRLNAFAVDPEFSVLVDAGEGAVTYNEAILRGLDYVVDQARHHGLRVLLVLTDYFRDGAGGLLQYMRLADSINLDDYSDVEIKALFYNNCAAKGLFYAYIDEIITRTNTINGRQYGSDPTVLGWDLMNEPRCEAGDQFCNDDTIPNFVTATYEHIRDLNPKQPITVGTDGFYDSGPKAGVFPNGLNPFISAGVNADFATLCNLVDFCEFNTYPDLWNQENEAWVDAWVAGHSADGVALGKPVIVKEQGMQPTDQRVKFYSIMYASNFEQMVADRLKEGGMRGAAYWQTWQQGTKAVSYTLAPGGRFGIFSDDPAAHFIRRFSDEVDGLNRHSVACPLGVEVDSVVMPLPKCKPGFEGPDCEDINECVRGTNDCSKNAACINTEGGFKCKCHKGYLGDGKICAPQAVHLEIIKDAFHTKDTINCASSSQPVPYPSLAPGWVEDPTGRYEDSYSGNRVPVTLLECKIACHMADDCSSFFWDAGQKKCLLRKNECPFITPNVPGCQAPGSGIPTPTICTDGQKYTPNSSAPPTPVPTFECGRAVTYFKKHAPLPANCAAPAT